MTELLSRKDQSTNAAEVLDYFLGQHCGDIYLTALDIFSRQTYPRETTIFLRDDLDYISGGLNQDGDIGVWVGMQPNTVTKNMRSRVNERFRLLPEQQLEEVYLPFILAHEIGHTVQRDPLFKAIFGTSGDDYIEPEDDYESYVNSHDELNADYIAAVIVGNSELGKSIGFMPPEEPPLDWRSWAEKHPIPETIALQSSL
jgi:hypothetical protein